MAVPGELPVVGDHRCPNCAAKFGNLRPSAGATRRDCKCGKRWTLRFVEADARFVAMLGPCVRVTVEPYVDGRKRKPPADPSQLQLELAPPDEETAPARGRKRPVRVERGTRFVTKRSGRKGASLR